MNKDAIYVIKQPVHSIVSIIVVNSDRLPIKPIAHRNIDALGEFSDLVFVFSDHFSMRGLNVQKFSNLYQASSYIYGSGDILGKPIFTALAYCTEIFRKHVAFIITDTEKLEKAKLPGKEKILTITGAPLEKPIFQITRLGPEELFEIYTRPDDYKPKRISPWWRFWKREFWDRSDTDRINSTFTSPSALLYIKASTIRVLLKTYESKEFKEYIDSFSEDDLSYLFASFLKALGIDNMDKSIEEIKLEEDGTI